MSRIGKKGYILFMMKIGKGHLRNQFSIADFLNEQARLFSGKTRRGDAEGATGDKRLSASPGTILEAGKGL